MPDLGRRQVCSVLYPSGYVITRVSAAAPDLKKINNDLGSLKGVLGCKLTMASKATAHLHYIGVRNDRSFRRILGLGDVRSAGKLMAVVGQSPGT